MSNEILYTQLFDLWPELKQFEDKIYIFCSAEYIHNPLEVADDIKIQKLFGKTKFLFYAASEALMDSFCEGIHKVVDILADKIDSTDFIYVSGGIGSAESYDKLCQTFNWTNRITILNCHFWEREAHFRFISSLPYTVKIKSKKFLCFNKVPRFHRIELLENMFKQDLVDSSYYSFDKLLNYDYRLTAEKIQEKYPHIHQNLHRLPLELNMYKDWHNPTTPTEYDLKYYENSYFSLVTETKFHHQDAEKHEQYKTQDTWISEKGFKPIAFKHPFIVLASCNYLKALQELGYKTFHPYINETYDTINNDEDRFKMIVSEVIRLCNQTDDEWLAWQASIKEIVEFNNQHLQTRKDHRITTDVEKYFK